MPKDLIECGNFIDGKFETVGNSYREVKSPYTGQVMGRVTVSGPKDVDLAVKTALNGFKIWSSMPLKERTKILFRFRENLLDNLDNISHCVSAESGKLLKEAKEGLLKGIEVLEFAISIQNLGSGGKMDVSMGVTCEYRREPLGVVAGITPFNFPAMVPMWMFPIAVAVGNSFIWKPSDKTPLTSILIAEIFMKSGLPEGVLTVLQGGRETVEVICEHPGINAIGFVGSTPAAKSVYIKASQKLKRALTLGGAKNHIILMSDVDVELAGSGIFSSFIGCAGQRCMAASVLLAVGKVEHMIERLVSLSKSAVPGKDFGAIISEESLKKMSKAVDQAERDGAKILVDGREINPPEGYEKGNWFGPTILDYVKPGSEVASCELFGPILSIIRVNNLEEAIKIENDNPFGNAAAVFTNQGGVASIVAQKSRAGMIGVNIGVPVPREPFSFGGCYDSKFGHGDITGVSSIDFWSNQKKVTTKWFNSKGSNWMG